MRVCVVPTMEPACKLGSERIEKRMAQLDAEMKSLDGRKWSASMFPTVFAGQPDVAWDVVQNLLEDITADVPQHHPM